MQDERPVIVLVHPDLKRELQARKEILEKEIGYTVHGGIPIVSKIAALELNNFREKNNKKINIEVHKKKGLKKVEMLKLW